VAPTPASEPRQLELAVSQKRYFGPARRESEVRHKTSGLYSAQVSMMRFAEEASSQNSIARP